MPTVSAVTYGLDASNTAAVNGVAIEDACAAAESGGTVTFPAGTFAVQGARLPSLVTLSLDAATVLNSTAGADMMRNLLLGATGSVDAGGTAVTVNLPDRFAVGSRIAIVGAGVLFAGDQSLAHYATVTAIVGSVLTIDTPAVRAAVSQSVTVGAHGITITGGTLDGNDVCPVLIRLGYANGITMRNVNFVGATLGGVMMELGSTRCVVQDCDFTDCGNPPADIGSAVWFFRGSTHNKLIDCTISGGYNGVYADDRTIANSVFDGPSDHNLIQRVTVTAASGGGLIAVGSSDNTFRSCVVTNCGNYGIGVLTSLQGGTPRPVERNRFIGCISTSNRFGVLINGDSNTFEDCTLSGNTDGNFSDSGFGNLRFDRVLDTTHR